MFKFQLYPTKIYYCLFFLSSFSTTFDSYRHTGTRTLEVRVYTLTDMHYKEVPIAPRGGERTSGFSPWMQGKICMHGGQTRPTLVI